MLLRTVLAAATVVVLTLSAGCSAADPDPIIPTPEEPTVEELFGSEEDARLAAEQALREYWAASASVFATPEKGVEALAPLVTANRLDAERDAAEVLVKNDVSQVGEVTVDTVRVQGVSADGDTSSVVVMACANYAAQTIVNSDGRVANRLSKYDRYWQEVQMTIEISEERPILLIDEFEHFRDRQC